MNYSLILTLDIIACLIGCALGILIIVEIINWLKPIKKAKKMRKHFETVWEKSQDEDGVLIDANDKNTEFHF